MRMRNVMAAMLVLVAGASGAQAQAGVAGTYDVDFDAQVRQTSDGTAEVLRRGKATLVIEVRGDSVFGTWSVIDPERNPPPRKLRGTLSGATLKFMADPTEATINVNGEARTMQTVTDYTGTIEGDSLKGSMTIRFTDTGGMMMNPAPRKFEGTRKKV